MIDIKHEQLLRFYLHIKHKADTYFDREVRPEWEMAERLYRDRYNFGTYKPEEECIKLPIADNLVTRLASVFSRALINLENEYFTVEQIPDELDMAAKGAESLVGYIYEDNAFPSMFNAGLEKGFITSIVPFKVFYEIDNMPIMEQDRETNEWTESNELIGKIRLKRVDPWNIRLDPTEDSDNYIMEIIEVPLHEFRDLADENDWDMEEVQRAIDKKKNSNPIIDPNTGAYNYEAFSPMICLRDCYARVVYDINGDEIADNIRFIVADDEFIVDTEKNRRPGGTFPYVVGRPLTGQTGKYGRGYLAKLAPLILSYIETVDLQMAQFRLAAWGMWAYDPSDIERRASHEFKAIVRPGAWYPVSDPSKIQNIYSNSTGYQMGAGMQNLLDFLLQTLSYQNEFVQARPTTKGRPTASEIRMKMNEAQSFFNDIAIELEDQIIAPLTKLVLLTAFTFWNDNNFIDKQNMVTDPQRLSALEGMNFIDRIKLIINGQIKARGMSGRIRRAAMFDKLALLFEIGAQYPPLLQSIPPAKIAKAFFESVGESAKEWVDEDLLEQAAQPQGNGGLTPEQEQQLNQQIEQGINQAPGGDINAGQ